MGKIFHDEILKDGCYLDKGQGQCSTRYPYQIYKGTALPVLLNDIGLACSLDGLSSSIIISQCVEADSAKFNKSESLKGWQYCSEYCKDIVSSGKYICCMVSQKF